MQGLFLQLNKINKKTKRQNLFCRLKIENDIDKF